MSVDGQVSSPSKGAVVRTGMLVADQNPVSPRREYDQRRFAYFTDPQTWVHVVSESLSIARRDLQLIRGTMSGSETQWSV